MKTAMTDEEKNRAIAFACGWKWEFNGDHEDPEWFWIPPDDPDGEGEPPDFLNSLDAMHEACESLEPRYAREKFPEWLRQIVARDEGFITNGLPLPEWHWVNATARQRAEAFLKIIQQP